MKTKIIILVFVIFASVFLYQNFILNVTPSEPLGIYKIHRFNSAASIKRGDIVALCLTPNIENLGLKRNYLLPGLRCGKSPPLIKTVIAIPGDIVELKNNAIIVNGKTFHYATKYIDSHGHALEVFPRGIYLNTQKYWLIGTNDPNSWDSRYWGGVERKQILFKLERDILF